MKKILLLIITSSLLLATACDKRERVPEITKGGPQQFCPVMEGQINKKFYTDYKGSRVYFCCPPCLDVFQKDPDRYIREMEESGVVLEKTISL